MKLSIALIVCCAVFVSPFMVQAETVEKEEPFRVIWDGKDVPPLCFEDLLPIEGSGPDHVAIAGCGAMPKKKDVKTYSKDGGIETEYRYDGDESRQTSYVAYKVIGEIDKGYVVQTNMSGGGSGVFSNVVVVKVDKDALLKVDEIFGGDRCNGGISSVSVDHGQVIVGRYYTPADFRRIIYKEKHYLMRGGLESSAASCFAEVFKKGDVITSIKLKAEALNHADETWVAKYKYQTCFNQVFSRQVQQKTDLSLQEFKEFVDHFYATCVKE